MVCFRVVVIGVGRIGAVTAVGLAHLEQDVTGLDRAPARVAALAAGTLPEAEPGLRAALTTALRFRRLTFTTTATPQSYDLAFLCVDTPPLPSGAPDLCPIFAAAAEAAGLLVPGGLLVTRSTIPAGTGDRITDVLRNVGRSDVEVVHVPEFLREGQAWEDFREPDRIVIGAESPAAIDRIRSVFAPLDRPIIATDRPTAELAKYAANAFLATSISFANEMADLCAATGADAPAVFNILRADRRIGPYAYLAPGLGFGGHCLPKDTAALAWLGATHGQAMEQLNATRGVNEGRVERVRDWLRGVLGPLAGRRICLAGLAFKPGTDDLRASPSVKVAQTLTSEGAQVAGWDPHVKGAVHNITVCATLDDALRDADALVVAHGWSGWRNLDPVMVRNLMRIPAVFDGPGVLGIEAWQQAGFQTNRPAPQYPVPAVPERAQSDQIDNPAGTDPGVVLVPLGDTPRR